MLALTIFFTLSALVTLVPDGNAKKVCRIGYKAHCSFVPWSTLISLGLAGASCKVRATRFVKKNKNKYEVRSTK